MILNSPQVNDTMMTEDMMGTEGIAGEEVARLEGYKHIYRVTHTFPEKRRLSFAAEFGIETFATIVAAIGAIVLASISTGSVFLVRTIDFLAHYNIPESVQQVLGWISMIAALGSVEGYLSARGIRNGKNRGSSSVSRIGMFAAFLISCLAGIANSLQLVNAIPEPLQITMNWALVAVSGIGATVLAYYGSENFGAIFYSWNGKLDEVHKQFQEEINAWNIKFQNDYRTKGRSRIFGMDSFKEERATPVEKQHVANVQASVRQYLKDRGLSAWDIGPTSQGKTATPKDIAGELGLNTPREQSNLRVILGRLRDQEQREQQAR
jgi:hypothetical protein